MTRTVRYAHLDTLPALDIGQKIKRNVKIGRMGNTGESVAAHLHIDCVEGSVHHKYSLLDMEEGRQIPDPKQLNYFIDNELFGTEIFITSYYADVEYQRDLKKLHLAYDVVPENRKKTTNNFDIFWNRSAEGTVIAKYFDKDGFGNTIHIAYDA